MYVVQLWNVRGRKLAFRCLIMCPNNKALERTLCLVGKNVVMLPPFFVVLSPGIRQRFYIVSLTMLFRIPSYWCNPMPSVIAGGYKTLSSPVRPLWRRDETQTFDPQSRPPSAAPIGSLWVHYPSSLPFCSLRD